MVQKILILGAGELGSAIVSALLAHPAYSSSETRLTISIRHETLQRLNSNESQDARTAHLQKFRDQGVSFVSTDLVHDPEHELVAQFDQYHTIIHAGAMTLPPGTQLRITTAVLASQAVEYVPWQNGVDYDIIGPEAGQGLFHEQCQVRALLRAQSTTKWFILSCGVFMSFLLEEFWGVVRRDEQTGKVTGVRALGGWDHLVTASSVEDIARCNAELVLVDKDLRGKPVFMASDSMTYEEFAAVVEAEVGYPVERSVWTTDELVKQSEMEPEDKLWKYRVVFSQDKGLAWPMKGTYNDNKGIETTGIAKYLASTRVLQSNKSG